jgi:hypothetical protein
MYLCYVDESGTPETSGNTSHFILAGLSVPIWHWKDCDREIELIKNRYALENMEIHIAWILRPYFEQTQIINFDLLDYKERRSKVEQLRRAELLRLQRAKKPDLYKQTRKNYRKTENYIHLNYQDREKFIKDITKSISGWGFARLFAECIDKIYFDPSKSARNIEEQCFEQIVSRFEQYLKSIEKGSSESCLGLLIHDNNETIAKKHTELMRAFRQSGTLWTKVKHIIEAPLFVDSQLTSMVQIADVCAYVLRRYLENNDDTLFDLIFQRADRKDDIVVGIRHFTKPRCACKICVAHRRASG